jgi:hypothetical protein
LEEITPENCVMGQDFRLNILLRKNIIEATILIKYTKGETAFVPRIPTNTV